MSSHKLALDLKTFLNDYGSIDAAIIDGADVALKFGIQGKCEAAIECGDKSIADLYLLNDKFKDLALGNDECYALPYRDNLILVFDLTEGI